MAGLNRQELMGNLVADAELRYTQTGKAVTSFRIGVNETYFSNGEKKERASFHNIVLWGKRGEGLTKAEALKKGQSIYVVGRTQHRAWENQEGVTKYMTEVVVGNNSEDLQLLARRGSQVPANPPPHSDEDAPGEDFSE